MINPKSTPLLLIIIGVLAGCSGSHLNEKMINALKHPTPNPYKTYRIYQRPITGLSGLNDKVLKK